MKIDFKLNGKTLSAECSPSENLKDLLRRLHVFSVRDACDGEGSCGLCAILLDGRLVNSCLILAVQIDGRSVITVEHCASDPRLATIQQALIDCGCVQCGYCTPALILAIQELLIHSADPDEAEIKDALSGIYCRCTGYKQFFDAVHLSSARMSNSGKSATPVSAPVNFRPDLRHIGKDADKVDAAALARGERAFVEDRVEADAYVLKLLGSPYAHAWIKSIDVSEALAAPGVVAVLTKDNCPDRVYTTAGQGFPEPSPYDQRMFPRKARFVGDRVAAVLAESEAAAQAALKLIKVDYEILPAVLSIADAKKDKAQIIHSGEVSYVNGTSPEGADSAGDGRDDPIVYQFSLHADPHRNLAASASGGIGDVEAGFKAADVVIERTYRGNRVQCAPPEPHTVYARKEGGRLILHASTQVPWHVRRIVAAAVGISENKVRVVKERVGGGFGAKQDILVEDIAGYLCWTTGRSVHYRFTRAEEFAASRTRHAMDITIKLGATKDGLLTAVKMTIDADTGAYGQHCLTVPMNAVSKSLPLLICANAAFEVKSWYTNLPVAGAYQGYGAPKGSFAVQTALAELAEALEMDQLALIELNRVRSHSTIDILKSLGEGRPGAAVLLGVCGLGDMINRGRKAFAWDEPKAKSGIQDLKIGRGAVIIQQGSGLPGLDAANAQIRLLEDGTILMLSGGADLGTGLDTVTAKIAAELLGLDLAEVQVLSGDTDATPFDKGAYASSGTFFSGGAALAAAEDLRSKILQTAAELLGEPEAELELVYHGKVVGKTGSVTLAELAHKSFQGDGFHELVGVGGFKTDHAAFPYGAHFAEVTVDSRTGVVHLRRYHAYQDCGTPINPTLAEGQIYGGVLKAIGHTLYEELIFDQAGRCLNPNFLDYKIPSICEMPDDFHVELMPVPDEVGPFGAKSVAEISVNGAAPAIAIAIHDAIGVWMREWPFTPERILKAMGKI